MKLFIIDLNMDWLMKLSKEVLAGMITNCYEKLDNILSTISGELAILQSMFLRL